VEFGWAIVGMGRANMNVLRRNARTTRTMPFLIHKILVI